MKLFPQKYYLCTILSLSIACCTFAQSNTVTIIGDPIAENPVNPNGSGGGNPYVTSTPPEKDQELANPKYVEPTFENGFHIRYEVIEPEKVEERPSNTGYEYASIATGSGAKVKKKHVATLTERSFNFRKRFKSWMPKRKKKYRPNICGRF